MNKNHLEQSKLSNRNTKSSLNFISNILIEPRNTSIKAKINYSKLSKPSFTRVANFLCRNESNTFNLTSSESTIKFHINSTEILQKLRKIYEDYQLTPFMKVREDYIEKKQRFLYDKKTMKENFDRETERIIRENKELNDNLKEFDGFVDREQAAERSSREVKKIGIKGELVKHLEKFSAGADRLDWEVVEKKIDGVFNGGDDFGFEDLIRFLSFKVLQSVKGKVGWVKNGVKCVDRVEKMAKEESLKGFETKASLNSMYY
jgi:hypothetical protein